MSSSKVSAISFSNERGAAGLGVWALGLTFPLVPLIALVLMLRVEPAPIWFAMPLMYFVVAPTLLDFIFGANRRNPTDDASMRMKAEKVYDLVAYAHMPIYFAIFFLGVALVGLTTPPVWAVGVLALGLGLINGNAINIAHELGHRVDQRNRLIAKLALCLSGYGHFTGEHNRGHHIHVATPEDCASARLGESVYAFARRELPGALRGGWALEADRLRRKRLPVLHWRNDVLQVYAATVLMTSVLMAAFGWGVLGFIVLHHFFSWYALTQVNYIEHYGLMRARKENGKYQPCEPRHSWNSNHYASNILSLNLQRHSDHHANPARPYQVLRDYDDVPTLPSGYPAAIAMAALPPLWFRVMDGRVIEWAGGDLEKTNLCPRGARRYRERYTC